VLCNPSFLYLDFVTRQPLTRELERHAEDVTFNSRSFHHACQQLDTIQHSNTTTTLDDHDHEGVLVQEVAATGCPQNQFNSNNVTLNPPSISVFSTGGSRIRNPNRAFDDDDGHKLRRRSLCLRRGNTVAAADDGDDGCGTADADIARAAPEPFHFRHDDDAEY
jgi:hypothetical protein